MLWQRWQQTLGQGPHYDVLTRDTGHKSSDQINQGWNYPALPIEISIGCRGWQDEAGKCQTLNSGDLLVCIHFQNCICSIKGALRRLNGLHNECDAVSVQSPQARVLLDSFSASLLLLYSFSTTSWWSSEAVML